MVVVVLLAKVSGSAMSRSHFGTSVTHLGQNVQRLRSRTHVSSCSGLGENVQGLSLGCIGLGLASDKMPNVSVLSLTKRPVYRSRTYSSSIVSDEIPSFLVLTYVSRGLVSV